MRLISGALSTVLSVGVLVAADVAPQDDALRKALVFHASFDGGTDALRAAGDPKLYWAPSLKQRSEGKPGLPDSGEVASAGELRGRRQTFTWDVERAVMALGLGYIGLFDELSVFNRALGEDEIQSVHIIARGISSLIR